MATYDELLTANGNQALLNKVRVAVVVAATAIMTESDQTTNHANRLKWAKEVFANPALAATQMMWPVLAQNKAFTLAQLIAADDATVQAKVDLAVNVFAQGA
ncbi:hypothetical protein C8R31_101655 [Nitrosospira sp. Nsp2]|uniref:hypothetical protein n=1 Tax=Nitrosospira sp. Nsp2 TaxID=136548 RepID=UPI000D310B11|nr:hypothetical protein [Nitrosospira sp. Nsp2]PTR17491.1 hypothetical protein C8R31_101655 [Nitrosospira sp. Nsp2]